MIKTSIKGCVINDKLLNIVIIGYLIISGIRTKDKKMERKETEGEREGEREGEGEGEGEEVDEEHMSSTALEIELENLKSKSMLVAALFFAALLKSLFFFSFSNYFSS